MPPANFGPIPRASPAPTGDDSPGSLEDDNLFRVFCNARDEVPLHRDDIEIILEAVDRTRESLWRDRLEQPNSLNHLWSIPTSRWFCSEALEVENKFPGNRIAQPKRAMHRTESLSHAARHPRARWTRYTPVGPANSTSAPAPSNVRLDNRNPPSARRMPLRPSPSPAHPAAPDNRAQPRSTSVANQDSEAGPLAQRLSATSISSGRFTPNPWDDPSAYNDHDGGYTTTLGQEESWSSPSSALRNDSWPVTPERPAHKASKPKGPASNVPPLNGGQTAAFKRSAELGVQYRSPDPLVPLTIIGHHACGPRFTTFLQQRPNFKPEAGTPTQ